MQYLDAGICTALVLGNICCGFAQSSIALSEMQSLAEGLDTCVLDTTYYVSLESLDDTSSSNSSPVYNYINDQGGTFVMLPDNGYFNPNRVNLVTAFNHWDGPYLTYQPSRVQIGTSPYDQGSPLDPWGNPYYFFSPLGLVRGDSGTVTLDLYADTFDRYTLVSLGPDGIKSSDDIFYAFGAGITGTRLSSLRSTPGLSPASSLSAPAGSTVIVRGINLGAQSGAQLLWGTQPLTNIVSWDDRNISVTLPQDLRGTGSVVMQRGSFTTNGVALTVTAPVTAAEDWTLFE